jgi:hypothetical protein
LHSRGMETSSHRQRGAPRNLEEGHFEQSPVYNAFGRGHAATSMLGSAGMREDLEGPYGEDDNEGEFAGRYEGLRSP